MPDNIPEDVMRASEAAWKALLDVRALVRAATIEECAKLIEEGFSKVVGESYADDPTIRSKNDQCPHGRYMYEDCDQCCADAIRALNQRSQANDQR